jgi:endonuclease/exonuclease/phosphatase family metal-dependent hydrolase
MKKTIRLLALVFAMLFMLCACNGGESTDTTPAATTPAATTPAETTPAATTPAETTPEETTAAPVVIDKTLRIMSFNIQCGISGTRDADVMEFLLNCGADSIGTQETGDAWVSRFRKDKTFREMYDWIGDGRDGNKRGERCSILYRKDKFDLVDSGTKWLSDTPDVSGSRLNGSEYIRIATYVILKDKVSGQEFMHINTHLDTSSSTIRAAQAKLAIELSPKRDDIPVFFTGDFNCSFESEGYNTITGTLGFVNSATKAVAGDKYTNQTSDYGAIDFIFIKNYNFTVDKYTVYTEKKISDHRPVFIDITLP